MNSILKNKTFNFGGIKVKILDVNCGSDLVAEKGMFLNLQSVLEESVGFRQRDGEIGSIHTLGDNLSGEIKFKVLANPHYQNKSRAAAVLGSARSEAKTAAARANGKKGGRPKKTQ